MVEYSLLAGQNPFSGRPRPRAVCCQCLHKSTVAKNRLQPIFDSGILSLLSSNTPKSLLVHSSVENAVFFTFLALVFLYFLYFNFTRLFLFEQRNPSKRSDILMVFIFKLLIALITKVEPPSQQYLQPHGARALGDRYFRSPRSRVPRVCAALYFSQKNSTSSSNESMTVYPR